MIRYDSILRKGDILEVGNLILLQSPTPVFQLFLVWNMFSAVCFSILLSKSYFLSFKSYLQCIITTVSLVVWLQHVPFSPRSTHVLAIFFPQFHRARSGAPLMIEKMKRTLTSSKPTIPEQKKLTQGHLPYASCSIQILDFNYNISVATIKHCMWWFLCLVVV